MPVGGSLLGTLTWRCSPRTTRFRRCLQRACANSAHTTTASTVEASSTQPAALRLLAEGGAAYGAATTLAFVGGACLASLPEGTPKHRIDEFNPEKLAPAMLVSGVVPEPPYAVPTATLLVYNAARAAPLARRLARPALWLGQALLGGVIGSFCILPIVRQVVYRHTEPQHAADGRLGPSTPRLEAMGQTELMLCRSLFVRLGCTRDARANGKPTLGRAALEAHLTPRIAAAEKSASTVEAASGARLIASVCFGLLAEPVDAVGLAEFGAFMSLVTDCRAAQANDPPGVQSWRTLDVAQSGEVSYEQLQRWVRVLLETNGVRTAHRYHVVRTASPTGLFGWAGGGRARLRPAGAHEVAEKLWARLGLPLPAENDVEQLTISRDLWLAHADAIEEVVDVAAMVKLLGEVPRFL